jgi:hypothetical protein
MTEQERVEKLKARMSRWQAYVDKQQTVRPQKAAETPETPIEAAPLPTPSRAEVRPDPEPVTLPVEIYSGRPARQADRPPPRMLQEAPRGRAPEREEGRATAHFSDPLTDMQEARIADLQHAIAREQEQAERLAEEVRRAQTLHAATIYSHLADEKSRQAEHQPAQRQIPEMPTTLYYEDERRRNLARVVGFLLIITSILTALFFMGR